MQRREYRYYEFVMVAFVVILICSNLIGPAKIAQIQVPGFGAFTFGAGVLFFPISYGFGDILTEVYGYGASRRAVLGSILDQIHQHLTQQNIIHMDQR